MSDGPSPPPPGSARFFALLYTPRALRDGMTRLLALADEIGAGSMRTLEPAVAQARLAWWRFEAQRFAARQPQHPWLKPIAAASAPAPPIDLPALIEAAAADPGGQQLRRALFIAAAELLGAGPLTPATRDALGELAMQSWQSEASTGAPPATKAPSALQGVQTRIVPLLVWAALATPGAKKGSLLRGFTDNMRAWGVARRASAGRYIP
jgi:hypothetical protein